MTTMKLFAQERRSHLRFNERNRRYLAANLKSIFYFSIFHPLIEVTASLATAVIIWYGGGQIITKRADLWGAGDVYGLRATVLLAYPRAERKIYHLPKRDGLLGTDFSTP